MRRYTLFGVGLAFVLAGCTQKPPTKPGSYTGMISAVGGLVEVSGKPAPKPAPAGKCDNCGGDGIVGDGTIEVKCGVCGGDGILAGRTADCPCGPDCPCPNCKCGKPAVVYVPLREPAAKKPKESTPEAKMPVRTSAPVEDCPSGMCGPRGDFLPPTTGTVSEGSSFNERRGIFRGRIFGRRRG